MSRAKSFNEYVGLNEGKTISFMDKQSGQNIVNPWVDSTGRDAAEPFKTYKGSIEGTTMETFIDNSEMLITLVERYKMYYEGWTHMVPDDPETSAPDYQVLRPMKKDLIEIKKAIEALIKLS